MGLGCGAQTAKIILFIFNALFFLCGAILLGIGIWIVVDKSALMDIAAKALGSDNALNAQLDSGSLVKYAAYVLIGVGVFNFFVGFCGCCGACTENRCLLGVYAFLIGLVMIIEIVGAILAGVYRNDVEGKLRTGLTEMQNASYIGLPRTNPVSQALDIVMVTFGCCGVNNVSDFTTNYMKNARKWYNEGRQQNETSGSGTFTAVIPFGCCIMKNKDFLAEGKYTQIQNYLQDANCGKTAVGNYKEGCFNRIKTDIMRYAIVLIAVAVGIILIELAVIIMACCLRSAIDD